MTGRASAPVAERIADLIGEPVATLRPLHGGSLSEVLLVSLQSGRRLVAKTGLLADREARMLQALRVAGAPAPEVLAIGDKIILLEALDEAPATDASWRNLGLALKLLHATEDTRYGWHEDYAFGAVDLPNGWLDDWPRFWAERRILPSLPHVAPDLERRLARLADRLDSLLPARPKAALLHGDLWTGNALFGPAGAAHMVDPACYFGDGEVDLAMLQLFGNPPPAFAEAYGPLAPGASERRAVYQIWPALVHLRLFGDGYRPMLTARLDALGA